MDKIREHFHIVVIALGVGIIAPIAYYFFYALPQYNKAQLDFEREKYETEQNAILEEQAEKDALDASLNACIFDADMSYSSLWDNQCSAWKVQVDDAWNDCRSLVYSWQTDESNKEDCKRTTPDYFEDETGACLLPSTRSDEVTQTISDMKDECYRKYPSTES